MPREAHEITHADIMTLDEYGTVRREHRAAITDLKKDRRVHIGPDATAYFECYETMWHQIHEMLYIEKGGEEQVEDELRAYNPLIPKGRELVCTLMFEIDDPVRRAKVLGSLGGVENTVSLTVDGEAVKADPEEDVERTNEHGKASSIQFLHFHFTAEQVEKFKQQGAQVILSIDHENYAHMAKFSEATRAALALDFD